MLNKQPHDPRRLLLLFVVATVVPAASLGWLAWRMVEQDRILEAKRVQERREQAADVAAAALQRVLAEAEERLTTFSAALISPVADLRNSAALVAFTRDGVLGRAGTLLPYYPAIPPSRDPHSTRLADADELELRKNDLAGALRIVGDLAGSRNPAVRGEATLRLARIYRKIGNLPKALEDFHELGKLGDTRVSGLPGGLRGRQGRALIMESSGRNDELHREAAMLCDDLEEGRWLLKRSQFAFAYQQARGWLSEPRPPISPDRLALAEAAESVWQEWLMRADHQASSRARRTFRSDENSVLVLTRSSPDRTEALLIGPRFLDSAWLKQLPSGTGQGVEFALTDAEGHAVLGRPNAPLSLQSIRPASATQLPWTVHAISGDNGFGPPELSGRTRLLLAGIAMMAAMMLAGGYFISRAVLRELSVARLQSDFVAAVSHEFRTPLTTLRQLSEMLVRGRVSNDGRRQQFYETLLRESERLRRLVEGLLNFGAMEAGKVQYRFERVDPDRFMREIVSDFEREVSGLGYRVELRGDDALPAIRADRESLARVFWNLLDNAVKYSPENRTVCVDLSEAGKRLMVRVRDRGLGIPAAEQKEIFRKFVRGAASKSSSIRGTGVGLAIARQIVAAHGGDISVESAPGAGSVFTVLLPLLEA
jgi:signal transduction histidine kinase